MPSARFFILNSPTINSPKLGEGGAGWALSFEPELVELAEFLSPEQLDASKCRMGAGSIHGRENVATHERKPFVKRACGC